MGSRWHSFSRMPRSRGSRVVICETSQDSTHGSVFPLPLTHLLCSPLPFTQSPSLYSHLHLQDYTSVKQEELRQFLLARLKIFYEEELDVPLVL